MRILLARHGQTLWNQQGRLQGQLDSALTDAGIAQAQALGQAWRQLGVRQLVASPLPRTLHTARLVAAQLDQHRLDTDERLVEQGFGRAEGLVLAEARRRYPQMPAVLDGIDAAAQAPEGESLQQTIDRAMAALHSLPSRFAEAATDRPLGLISHGRVLQGVVWVLLGQGEEGSVRYRHGNASYAELSLQHGQLQLLRWGVADHLQPAATAVPA